jgi:hypothetical protein
MLIAIPRSRSGVMNSAAVNWEPWSELKISGFRRRQKDLRSLALLGSGLACDDRRELVALVRGKIDSVDDVHESLRA